MTEHRVLSIFAPAIETGAQDAVPDGAPRLRVLGLTLFAPVQVQHRRLETPQP